MAIPWSSIKSALIFFGPWFLPRIVAYYRRLQAEAARQQQQQRLFQSGNVPGPAAFVAAARPLTTRATVLLALLVGAALAWLVSAGLFSSSATSLLPSLLSSLLAAPPENIFATTQSRLQAPTDVLFNRLAVYRPGRVLTAADEALRARFTSLDARLLYLQFGPDVLLDCLFCDSGSGSGSGGGNSNGNGRWGLSYLAYALVDLLVAHMANLVLVAIATSPLLMLGRRGGRGRGRAGVAFQRRQVLQALQGHQLQGSQEAANAAAAAAAAAASAAAAAEAAEAAANDYADDYVYDCSKHYLILWRTRASLAALALAALDAYLLVTYDRRANARATTLAALDPFYWRMRTLRGIACAALLAALATLLRWALTTPLATQTSIAGLVLFGAPPPLPLSSPVVGMAVARAANATRRLRGVGSKLSAGAIFMNTALRDADLRARSNAFWERDVQLGAEVMGEPDVVDAVRDALASNRINLELIARDAAFHAQNILPPAPAPAQTAQTAQASRTQAPKQTAYVQSATATPLQSADASTASGLSTADGASTASWLSTADGASTASGASLADGARRRN